MSTAAFDLAGAAILFDLDGTLVDTAPDLVRALNAVLVEEGRPAVPLEAVRTRVGHGARALLEAGGRLGEAPFEVERLDALTERFVEIYRADIAAHSRPFPGAEALLDQLLGAGATLAVCTNKRTLLSIELLEAMGLAFRFAAIVGADAVSARKPHPAHVLETLARAGGKARRAVMIGDTAPDVQAAKAAGVPVIAVDFGYADDARALGADAVISHFQEAPRLLATWLAKRG